MNLILQQAAEKSLGVLRRAQDERIRDLSHCENPIMLSLSKHVPLFSADCQSCAMDCCFGRKGYSVTGYDVNLTIIRERGLGTWSGGLA
jgi:hypothetical protein